MKEIGYYLLASPRVLLNHCVSSFGGVACERRGNYMRWGVEKPRPLWSLSASHYRIFVVMKEWPAALPQQPANPTGNRTGWPLPRGAPLAHSVNPPRPLHCPEGLNTIGNKSSTTASPGPNAHTHIHENTHQNIPVKALLGSLSIQGHFRRHPSGGSVPNHSWWAVVAFYWVHLEKCLGYFSPNVQWC